MSFAPPSGPPPPSVPEGWKAQFDNRYKQWFYVNLRTGKSQWDRPEEPHEPPPGAPPPPPYEDSGPANPSVVAGVSDRKSMGSNNPYNQTCADDTMESDAQLAARLQAEEDARANRSRSASRSTSRGANADYYNASSGPQQAAGYSTPPAPVSQSAPPEQQSRSSGSRGLLGRLMGKHSSSSSNNAAYGRPPPPQPHPQPYAYQQGYSGYPPPQANYGYPPQQGYGYSGYPAQGGYYGGQQQPQKKHGMGTAGAAALGVGGGLLGGVLLGEAIEGFEDHHDFDGGPPPDDGWGGGGGGGFDDGGFDDGDFGGGF